VLGKDRGIITANDFQYKNDVSDTCKVDSVMKILKQTFFQRRSSTSPSSHSCGVDTATATHCGGARNYYPYLALSYLDNVTDPRSSRICLTRSGKVFRGCPPVLKATQTSDMFFFPSENIKPLRIEICNFFSIKIAY
jgi:hypothetical protein